MWPCRTRPSMSPMATSSSTSGPRSSPAATSPRRSPARSSATSTSRRASARASTTSSSASASAPAARSGSPASWSASGSTAATKRAEHYRVWRGRTGKYVLHVERQPEWWAVDSEGKPAGWRGHLGIGDVRYGAAPKESTLEVLATLDELRDKVPPELFDMVVARRAPADRGGARHLSRGAARRRPGGAR